MAKQRSLNDLAKFHWDRQNEILKFRINPKDTVNEILPQLLLSEFSTQASSR